MSTNGTEINSDASHTLIFADQAKPNRAFEVICVNPAFSALICVPLPLTLLSSAEILTT
jgi:hypothetical protein